MLPGKSTWPTPRQNSSLVAEVTYEKSILNTSKEIGKRKIQFTIVGKQPELTHFVGGVRFAKRKMTRK